MIVHPTALTRAPIYLKEFQKLLFPTATTALSLSPEQGLHLGPSTDNVPGGPGVLDTAWNSRHNPRRGFRVSCSSAFQWRNTVINKNVSFYLGSLIRVTNIY